MDTLLVVTYHSSLPAALCIRQDQYPNHISIVKWQVRWRGDCARSNRGYDLSGKACCGE